MYIIGVSSGFYSVLCSYSTSYIIYSWFNYNRQDLSSSYNRLFWEQCCEFYWINCTNCNVKCWVDSSAPVTYSWVIFLAMSKPGLLIQILFCTLHEREHIPLQKPPYWLSAPSLPKLCIQPWTQRLPLQYSRSKPQYCSVNQDLLSITLVYAWVALTIILYRKTGGSYYQAYTPVAVAAEGGDRVAQGQIQGGRGGSMPPPPPPPLCTK